MLGIVRSLHSFSKTGDRQKKRGCDSQRPIASVWLNKGEKRPRNLIAKVLLSFKNILIKSFPDKAKQTVIDGIFIEKGVLNINPQIRLFY